MPEHISPTPPSENPRTPHLLPFHDDEVNFNLRKTGTPVTIMMTGYTPSHLRPINDDLTSSLLVDPRSLSKALTTIFSSHNSGKGSLKMIVIKLDHIPTDQEKDIFPTFTIAGHSTGLVTLPYSIPEAEPENVTPEDLAFYFNYQIFSLFPDIRGQNTPLIKSPDAGQQFFLNILNVSRLFGASSTLLLSLMNLVNTSEAGFVFTGLLFLPTLGVDWLHGKLTGDPMIHSTALQLASRHILKQTKPFVAIDS